MYVKGVVETPLAHPNENAERFDSIVRAMSELYASELYAAKNADYVDSFSKSFERFGLTSAIVRIGDKYERLCSLLSNERRVASESIRDTLIDMANYAVMTVMELDKRSGDGIRD